MTTPISENFPESIVRENIKRLTPYSTARDESNVGYGTYLDANENPYNTGYNRYPDPHHKILKRELALIKGVNEDMIFAGNGSDEAIDLVIRVFCEPGRDNILSISPTYGMYKVAASINDIEYREAPLKDDFSLDSQALLKLIDKNTKVIFLCSPNNPTGNLLDKETVLSVVKEFKGLVVVDEAYGDFSGDSGYIPLLKEYPNLVVLQTMSKSMGMAALRVGFAFGDSKVISYLNRVKYPYNLNRVSQEMAIRRIKEGSKTLAEIISERERVKLGLTELSEVLKVYDSSANFLLVKFKEASGMYNLLLNNGVIVRDRSKTNGCEGCLRISIGKPAENDRLLMLISNFGKETLAATENPFVEVTRITRETAITLKADFTGGGLSYLNTGIGFFDHMLDQISTHGGISLDVDVSGDLWVDVHHTVEDVAIVLGDALNRYFTSAGNYERYGFSLPMDESEATVLIDLGGRAGFSWKVDFRGEKIGEFPCEMFSHFFSTLASAGKFTLNVKAEGENDHHKAEAVFKAFARALKMALASGNSQSVPSSKGII
ncbi:MAG: histidinol-phosphate transaminase [Bacteroidetes bacterium HGW-Bacteroidetes-7]|jgi:histidinol-phosphate aminotransferase|nr:MAG: histidinol-phosphate transaminase [Bacteroidetes bacterium HGW-Bacteroidetes-7]